MTAPFALTLGLSLILATSAGAQTLYRWVDERGEEHFTDDLSRVPKRARLRPVTGEISVVGGVAAPPAPPPSEVKPATSRTEGTLQAATRALLAAGRLGEAVEPLERSLRELRGPAPAELERDRTATYSLLVEEAERELAKARPDSGHPLLRRLLKLPFEDSRRRRSLAGLHVRLASAHLSGDRPEAALQAASEALALDPANSSAWFIRGEVHFKRDDLEGAIAEWEKGQRHQKSALLTSRIDRASRELAALSNFQIIRSEHFSVRSEGRYDAEAARFALDRLELARTQLVGLYGRQSEDAIGVVLYPDKKYHALNDNLASWSHGHYGRKIGMASGGALAYPEQFSRTLFHEYGHAVFERATAGRGGPAWLNEGLAQLAANTVNSPPPLGCLFGHGRSLAELKGSFGRLDVLAARVAYPVALHAVQLLEQEHGRGRFPELLARISEGVAFEKAFEQTFGLTVEAFDAHFAPDQPRP